MTALTDDDLASLHERAYAAMDRGALGEASRDFQVLLQYAPGHHSYHYMRGLAHKYMLDWPASFRHNLRAIELAEEMDESEHWNAAIAATALGDWAQARRLWTACGLRVPEGDGPIDDNYGVAVVRLNPWHHGETLFMQRIDPVRARLLNVPLPESGHRFGDIVLHDGAATGRRKYRDGEVPVFNELARLAPSEFQPSPSSSTAKVPTTWKRCSTRPARASDTARIGRTASPITACAAAMGHRTGTTTATIRATGVPTGI